jgi:hypothetical protein
MFKLITLSVLISAVFASADSHVALEKPPLVKGGAARKYPLYKQCDSKWGSDPMGADGETVCAVGCFMSSVSMALGGSGIAIDSATSNPGTLNEWLRSHGGYTSGSALIESVVPKIAPTRIRWPADGAHFSNDIPLATIGEMVSRAVPRVVIANVDQGHHFVLVTGIDAAAGLVMVNDPGFERNSYSYSADVVGWRIFDMS